MELRGYQTTTCAAAVSATKRVKRVLVQGPTGCGKSVLCAEIIRLLGGRALVLAHRRELITQNAAKLRDAGVETGIIMAGHYPDPKAPVQVASIQTLQSRIKRGTMKLDGYAVVAVDEAHRALAKSYTKIVQPMVEGGAISLGFTATPIRGDGAGLGRVYDEMVRTPGINWMIENFFLERPRYWVPFVPKMEGVRVVAGEWDKDQVAEIMNQKHLVGDIVLNWCRIAKGKPTMVFCSGVAHSISVCEAFNEAGFPWAHVDAHTKKDVRDSILRKLETGELQGVCNDSVYVEGTDVPCLQAIVLAKPVRQIGTYIQMAGRGMRPFPGKSGFDIIDHSGCFYEHGRIDVDFEWMLTKGKKMRDLVKQQREKQVVERVCRECKYIFAGSLRCPNCGLIAEKRGIFKDYIDADLVRLTYGDVKNMRREKWTPEMKRKFYRELVTVATVRCEKRGKGDPLAIASAMFKSRFDAFPPWKWRDLDPLPVTPETKAWVTSNNIRFARRKDKERAAA